MKKDVFLRRMTGGELAWRARVWARTQAQRVVTRVRPPRWDRRLLARALAPGVADAAMRRAMSANEWRPVHQALLSRLTGRPARFVLDPASAETLVAELHRRWPHAAADAVRRADRMLAGHYDLLGYED